LSSQSIILGCSLWFLVWALGDWVITLFSSQRPAQVETQFSNALGLFLQICLTCDIHFLLESQRHVCSMESLLLITLILKVWSIWSSHSTFPRLFCFDFSASFKFDPIGHKPVQVDGQIMPALELSHIVETSVFFWRESQLQFWKLLSSIRKKAYLLSLQLQKPLQKSGQDVRVSFFTSQESSLSKDESVLSHAQVFDWIEHELNCSEVVLLAWDDTNLNRIVMKTKVIVILTKIK